MTGSVRRHLRDVLPRIGPWIALIACALAPYAHTLQYGFINYDDAYTIVQLPLIRQLSWQALPHFFVPDLYEGLPEYMPLKNLSYALDYRLFGLSPAGFRLQQWFWYVAAVVLTALWLRMLLTRLARLGRLGIEPEHAAWLALATSALFALHPVHVESVTWLSGRKDVLCGAFMSGALAAALAFTARADQGRAWGACSACLACVALALLSKPTAVALAPLLLVQELWLAPTRGMREHLRARLSLHGSCWLLVLTYAAFYTARFGTYARISDAWIAHVPAHLRIGQQLLWSLSLVVAPSELTPLIPPGLFSSDPSSVPAVLGACTLLASLLVIVLGWGRRTVAAFATLLFVVPLLPSLFRPVWGQYVAGRYLFHAVLGPILGLTTLIAIASTRAPRVRPLLATASLAVACLWGGITITYNSAFKSSDALWAHAIAVRPTYGRLYELGAGAALVRRDYGAAAALLERCLKAAPDSVECPILLGELLLPVDPKRGQALLQESLPRDTTGAAHLPLARYWSAHGRTREAFELYERFLSGRPTGADQLGALAELAVAAGLRDKARDYLRHQVLAARFNQPASPPSASVLRVSELIGDPQWVARVRLAAARCSRNDCFANALGLTGCDRALGTVAQLGCEAR